MGSLTWTIGADTWKRSVTRKPSGPRAQGSQGKDSQSGATHEVALDPGLFPGYINQPHL